MSEIAYQVDAAVEQFHAVHITENGRWKREVVDARNTIYKVCVEQRSFVVADDDRDIGKWDCGLDGQNAIFKINSRQNDRGLSWALPFWHIL